MSAFKCSVSRWPASLSLPLQPYWTLILISASAWTRLEAARAGKIVETAARQGPKGSQWLIMAGQAEVEDGQSQYSQRRISSQGFGPEVRALV